LQLQSFGITVTTNHFFNTQREEVNFMGNILVAVISAIAGIAIAIIENQCDD